MAAPNMAELIERYAEDKQLETTVVIAPHLIRMNINHVIQDRLIKGMQGKCSAKDGFVIKLKRVVDITGGAIEQRTGSVTYHVKYLAQCLRPRASHTVLDCPAPNGNCDHQGDTVEAIVSRVLKMGIFADLGPLSIFVPESLIPPQYQFNGHSYASPDDAIKQQSLIRVKLQHIEMLDDNHLPSNTTSCVLKAMGALVVPTKQN